MSWQRYSEMRKKNNFPLYLMPWPVILTVLTLSLISAGLVFLLGWEALHAFLMVGLTATGILFILIGAILVLGERENRAENWRIFTSTFLDDLDQVLRYFRIRKR